LANWRLDELVKPQPEFETRQYPQFKLHPLVLLSSKWQKRRLTSLPFMPLSCGASGDRKSLPHHCIAFRAAGAKQAFASRKSSFFDPPEVENRQNAK
jgi:hypothetical protein